MNSDAVSKLLHFADVPSTTNIEITRSFCDVTEPGVNVLSCLHPDLPWISFWMGHGVLPLFSTPTSCLSFVGSCAILAMLDTARQNLYVARNGDCRAVAGVWEENPDGTGSWKVEVLSEDQTGRSNKEAER